MNTEVGVGTKVNPPLSQSSKGKGIYRKYMKRTMDIALSFLALIALSPVLLLTALLVRIKLGSPVLFKQRRPGRHGKIFTMYKFRTMTDARDERGEPLPDEVRLTRFGRLLRSTSLDELPELFNILKGDMSLIGPRPLLVQYLPLYTGEQMRRHEVRPGLSGLAQVRGRNAITWEERLKWDVEYVDRITFAGDVRLIWLTLKMAVRREGINGENAATMSVFTGTKAQE